MTMEKHAVGQLKASCSTSSSSAGHKKQANDNCYVTQTPATLLESLSYYYGCISREDAEWILYDEGCPDGMYLLRESGSDLVLSLCHHNSVLHYRINKLSNGDVVLQGLPTQTFASPMELIDTVDGLACKPNRPLKALYGKCLPPNHWNLAEDVIREQLILRAANWGLSEEQLRDSLDCDLHFSASFSPLVRSLIVKSLHEIQPWYHYRLSRSDAERRLEASGHVDGKFLVRERDESSYAICLSHELRVKHYRIDILPSGNFAIQDGPKFDSIIALVSHYTIFSGGLWCMLGEACPRPQEMIRQLAEQSAQINNQIYSSQQLHHHLHHNHASMFHGYGRNQFELLAHQQHSECVAISPKIRSRSIERYENGLRCKMCIKTMQHNRRRRVSTPTNAKLKEWFTTINHKWARIKRQVILHHQRQQPLINDDNYGTTEEFTCCQVKSSKTTTTTPKTTKVWRTVVGKNESSGLVNGHAHDAHHHHQHPHCPCAAVSLHCPSLVHRYANGFGVYGATCARGFGHRRQQYGKWPEEPIFGSRYAFETETPSKNLDRKTSDSSSSEKEKAKKIEDDSNKETDKNEATSKSNGNRYTIDRANFMDISSHGNVSLIKSSSIDTIAALTNDPLEEVRRLHLRQEEGEESNEMSLPPHLENLACMHPLYSVECATTKVFPLQRTNSFDNATAVHCNCNCSDWLLDFDVNDPFGSLQDDQDEHSTQFNGVKKTNGESTSNGDIDLESSIKKSTTFEELTNIFTLPVTHPKPNGWNEESPKCSSVLHPRRSESLSGANEVSHATRPSHPPPPPPSNFSPRSTAMDKQQQQQQDGSPTFTSNTLSDRLNLCRKAKQDNLVECHYRLQQHQPGRSLMTRRTRKQHPSAGLFSHSGTSSGSSTSSSGGGGVGGGSGVAERVGGVHAGCFSTNSSSGSSASFTASGSSSTFSSSSNRSFTGATPASAAAAVPVHTGTGHLSLHSASLLSNAHLMDGGGGGGDAHDKMSTTEINHEPANHDMSGTPSFSMTLQSSQALDSPNNKTSMAASCLNKSQGNALTTSTTATATAHGNGIETKAAPIIDLLKEFDVCFPSLDIVDDDSSTQHSGLNRKSMGVNHTALNGNFNDSSSPKLLMSMSQTFTSATFVNGSPTLPAPTIAPPAPPSGLVTNVSSLSSSPTCSSQSPCLRAIEKCCLHQQQQQLSHCQVPLGDGNEHVSTNGHINQSHPDNDNNISKDKLNEIELICLNEELEEVQETIKKYRRGPICFDPRCISLKRRIGNGYFGDVFLASIPCTSTSASINLAVKMLKSHAVPQQKAEILREAQTMAKLDHRHIVRLIGVCEGDPFMLVMELAPLGPLNKYLQNHGQNLSEDDILRLMLQVARAMQYLEEMSFVHRDLAARNILLVNEKYAKVSDFGMSRALGQGKDYYKARSASKWPLKWYAPECIYYYKFSSKSDVWSYGVALWEAISLGEMPYQGMDGQDILRMFAENRRLPKPEKCAVIIYQIMWSCWQFKPEERLNFGAISEQLSHYLNTRLTSHSDAQQAETTATPRAIQCLGVN